jgi:hypothetical protein
MSISYPAEATKVVGIVATINKIPTTASTELFPANANRAGGAMLINNSKAVLWIRLDVAANAAAVGINSCFPIPANGGNYRLPDQYQGAIQGVLAAAVTGTIQFIEPNY